MNLIDIVIIIILIIIFTAIILFMISQKKKGIKCIGCPFAKNCKTNKVCKK